MGIGHVSATQKVSAQFANPHTTLPICPVRGAGASVKKGTQNGRPGMGIGDAAATETASAQIANPHIGLPFARVGGASPRAKPHERRASATNGLTINRSCRVRSLGLAT